jgi:hypothetical protein
MNNLLTAIVLGVMHNATVIAFVVWSVVAVVSTDRVDASGAAKGAPDRLAPRPGVRVAAVPVVSEWVSTRELEVAKREVTRLWAPYGVSVIWLQRHADCLTPPAPDFCLYAIFEKQLRQLRRWTARPSLGQVDFLADGTPHPEIRVGYTTVVEVLAGWDRRRFGPDSPKAVRTEGVGRAIGRVLAHEIGHVLLASPAHAGKGLMRRSFPPQELAGLSADPFSLTPTDEASLIVRTARLNAAQVVRERPGVAAEISEGPDRESTREVNQ